MPRRFVVIATRVVCAALAVAAFRRAHAQRPEIAGARPLRAGREDAAAASTIDRPISGASSGWPAGREVRFGNGSPWHLPGGAGPVWWAPVASLVVPGSGQAALRQSRGVAYIAAEAYAWVQALEFRRESNRRRSESRRRAREVARAPFGAARDTTGWSYYEWLEEKIESGPYNTTPGGPLTPPTDTTTYNGTQWRDARNLYWDADSDIPTSDPRYQRALAYYAERAVKEEFRWSWRERQIEWINYQADIARENQLSRDFTTTLIVIGANHLVSSIDALTSVRIRQARGLGGERRFEVTVPWTPFGRRPPRGP